MSVAKYLDHLEKDAEMIKEYVTRIRNGLSVVNPNEDVRKEIENTLFDLYRITGIIEYTSCRMTECNILYHSLPFARICAGTHLSILAVTAFVSIVRRSLLRAFHSLVFSSTARLSSLVTHTVAGHSSACVALVSEVHGVWARGSRERNTHRQQRQQQRGRPRSRRLTQRRRRSNIGGGQQQHPRSHYVHIHTRG